MLNESRSGHSSYCSSLNIGL